MTLLHDCDCPGHPEGAVFYVTALDDRGRFARLSGPFETHQAAIDASPAAVKWAWDHDPRGPWYKYGTSAIITSTPALGALQRLGAI